MLWYLNLHQEDLTMCSPQYCVHEVKYNHLFQFGFVWEVQQMTKVRSCERLQRRCRCSKILEGLWPVYQAQSTWDWLWFPTVVSVYYRTRLEHMTDLMFSQPQIRNPVEYHFGLGLEFWNASDDEWFFTRWRKSWGLRIHRRRLYTLARCRSNTTIVSCSTRNITSGQWRGAAEGLFGEVSQHVGRLQTVTARLSNR